jgi:hypothetical protein
MLFDGSFAHAGAALSPLPNHGLPAEGAELLEFALPYGAEPSRAVAPVTLAGTARIEEDFASTHIYERVWIDPPEIDAGLVVTVTPYNIETWNAYRDRGIVITAVTPTDADDTTLAIVPPVTIPRRGNRIDVLTILTTGDAYLDGEWTFSWSAPDATRVLPVTATRVPILALKHDWADGFQIRHEVSTRIWANKKLYEQRLPLYSTGRRNFDLATWARDAYKHKNMIQKVANLIFGVAIFSEPLTVNTTGSLQGLTVIPITQDLTYYWNVQHCTYMILWRESTGEVEPVLLHSWAAHALTLDKAVINNWDALDVTVYPMLVATCREFSIADRTAEISDFTLTPREYIVSG